MRRQSTIILSAAAAMLLNSLWPTHAADGVVDSDRHLFHRPYSGITSMRQLEPVEQRFEDVDPLAAGLRRIDLGLRQPIGFEEVYRVPGDDEHFFRIDGGLYAVFPQSVYANVRFGEIPLIPANTVFWIGTPDFLLSAPQRASSNQVATTVRQDFVVGPEAMRITGDTAGRSFFTDPMQLDHAYKVQRDEDEQRAHRSAVTGSVMRVPSRYRAAERQPMPSTGDIADARDARDADESVDREQFRQRMRELLHRAAEVEAGNRAARSDGVSD